IEHSALWNGKFTAQFRVPWNAKPGDKISVKVSVEDVAHSKPFESCFTLVAEREQEPRKPGSSNGKPPGGKPGQKSSAPALAIPEVLDKQFDDSHIALQVRHDDKGQHEYFLNTNNAFLITELSRAKDDEKPLVKFWFKYGLLLCALGMLKEQQ